MISNACPNCAGDGFVPTNDEDRLIAIYGEELGKRYNRYFPTMIKCPVCHGTAQHTQRLIDQSMIPEDYKTAMLSDFSWEIYKKDKDIIPKEIDIKRDTFVKFVNEFDSWREANKGLYLWSRTRGSGKSLLASVMMNEIVKNGNVTDARFVQEIDLIPLEQDGRIEPYKSCDLLIIDDMGMKTVGNDWLSEIYFQILETRMHQKKMTIVTSNYPLRGLPLDERVKARMTNLIVCHMPEVNVRELYAAEGNKKFKNELGIGG